MNSDVLAYVAISIILFLLGRELVCWYFKINHRLDLLEEIRDLLKEGKESPASVPNKKTKNSVSADDDSFYKDNKKSGVMRVSDGEISIINTDKK